MCELESHASKCRIGWVSKAFEGFFMSIFLIGMFIFKHPEIPHWHHAAWSALHQKPSSSSSSSSSYTRLAAAKSKISSGITLLHAKESLWQSIWIIGGASACRQQGCLETPRAGISLRSPFVTVRLETRPEEQVCMKPWWSLYKVQPCVTRVLPQPCTRWLGSRNTDESCLLWQPLAQVPPQSSSWLSLGAFGPAGGTAGTYQIFLLLFSAPGDIYW